MLETGSVVIATHGRDKGRLYLVVSAEHDRVGIADGGRRRLEKPKLKNPAHLQSTGYTIPPEQLTGNKRLKRLLGEIGQRETANSQAN